MRVRAGSVLFASVRGGSGVSVAENDRPTLSSALNHSPGQFAEWIVSPSGRTRARVPFCDHVSVGGCSIYDFAAPGYNQCAEKFSASESSKTAIRISGLWCRGIMFKLVAEIVEVARSETKLAEQNTNA